jgi:class 3 adenylate cyclase
MNVSEFIHRHPWPEKWRALATPLDFYWQLDVDATPAELWPFIADTSRMNRAMGVSRMHFEERDGVLHGRSRNGGVLQEWIEVPWSWVAERNVSSTRIYQRGLAHVVRAIFELSPSGDGKTKLEVYFGWVPRGVLQAWILRIGMGRLEQDFARVVREIEGQIHQSPEAPPPLRVSVPPPSPEAAARVQDIARQLVEQGSPAPLVRELTDYLTSADDIELTRIQVPRVARRLGLDEDALLGACLRATRLGLLALSWDVICPHCRGVRAELKTLGEVPRKGDCRVCGIDFENDSEGAIEVAFHVHPSIREVQKVFFCSAEPAFKAHIRVQQTVEPGASRRIPTALGPGRYRLRAGSDAGGTIVEVDPAAQSAELRWTPEHPPEPTCVKPSPTLILENSGERTLAFVVESSSWSEDALRAGRLLGFQEFRDLFSEEYVSADVQLSVGRQTILFTDVVGSTRLYSTRGDPGAFVDVKKHFTEIYQVVAEHRGAIVKTIGDAAMVAFSDPVEALKAAKAIHDRLPPGREDLGIRVRISLNTGPCIAVNLNTNIDYFGNTVNVAAKIQACAEAGQVAFTESVLEQSGVAAYLENQGATLVERSFEVVGHQLRILRWDVHPA